MGPKMTAPDDDACQRCQPEELIQSDDVDVTQSALLYTVYWNYSHSQLRLSITIIPCNTTVTRVNVLLADGADEAGGVVGLAQCGNHFSLNKVPTAIAAGTVHALVVQRAQILSIFHEEAPLGKVTATHCRRHTLSEWVRSFNALKRSTIKPPNLSMAQWLS